MQYKSCFQNIILWYSRNKRDLPFRGVKDPYKTWLSETMLQQTQVKSAIPYYNRWVERFPTLNDVSNANIEELLKLWEGLGYYRRVHNFFKPAKVITKVHNGVIPKNYNSFISLPGVGEYTAAAVLSIAYEKPYPAIDVNVKRVLARILGIKNFTVFNNRRIYKILKKNIELFHPGLFNQSLMELGALICKPKQPVCPKCPARLYCKGFNLDNPEVYPVIKKRKKKPHYSLVSAIIWRGENFYIQKRNNEGMLPGLWETPSIKIKKGEKPEISLIIGIQKKLGIPLKIIDRIGVVEHAYSHFSITLHGFNCVEINSQLKGVNNFDWISKMDLGNFTFPRANYKLFNLIDQKV